MATPEFRTPVSTAAITIATAIVAGQAGYMLGTASSLGLLGGNTASKPRRHEKSKSSDMEDESGSEDEPQADLNGFSDSYEECKLVLVVRTDLGMTKGIFTPSLYSIQTFR